MGKRVEFGGPPFNSALTRTFDPAGNLARGRLYGRSGRYRYALAPYAWDAPGTPGNRSCWRPPASSVGVVDLRPLPAQGTAGGAPQGFAFVAATQPVPGVLITQGVHISEESSTGAILDAWQAAMGYRPAGATLTDLLWDQLTTGSDPTGQSGPLPLVPGADDVLRLVLGGHSVIRSERFAWGRHPHTAKLRDHFRHAASLVPERFRPHWLKAQAARLKLHPDDALRELTPAAIRATFRGDVGTDRTDDFNRANSSTSLGTPSDAGSNWVAAAGTWGITGNQAYNPGAGFPDLAYLESSIADADTQHTHNGTPYHGGTLFRYSDTSNYLFVEVDGANGRLELHKVVAGVDTGLGTDYTYTPAAGDVIKVNHNGSSLDVFLNGTSRVTATDSFNSTATKHGLYNFAGDFPRWDDFSITALGGGGTTVSPDPVTMAASVAGVTVLLTQAPAAVTAADSVVNPATALGQVPTPVAAVGSVPAVSTGGEMTTSPSPVTMTSSTAAPAQVLSQGSGAPGGTCGVAAPGITCSQSGTPVSAILSVVTPGQFLSQGIGVVPAPLTVPPAGVLRTEAPGAVSMISSVVQPSQAMTLSRPPVTAAFSMVTPFIPGQEVGPGGHMRACFVYEAGFGLATVYEAGLKSSGVIG